MTRLNCELTQNCADFPAGFISALTLNGSTLTGESVNVRAGALTIESLQDTSTFSSRQTTVGGSGYGDSALNYLKLSALFLFAACRAEGPALIMAYDAFEL